jgi:hypothetical protein
VFAESHQFRLVLLPEVDQFRGGQVAQSSWFDHRVDRDVKIRVLDVLDGGEPQGGVKVAN